MLNNGDSFFALLIGCGLLFRLWADLVTYRLGVRLAPWVSDGPSRI